MRNKIVLSLVALGCMGLVACIEKQPIDYDYYHQTHGISYQEGEESPFTEEEIAQSKKDEAVLTAALTNTTSAVRTDLWETEMRRICITELGFPLGTTSYAACRAFYDQQVYQYGINTDAITAAQIAAFLAWTNPIIHQCHGFGYVGDLLWGCFRDREYRHFRVWAHRHPNYRRWEHRPHRAPVPHHRPMPHRGPAMRPHHGPALHHGPAPKPHAAPAKGPAPHGGKPMGGPKH